VKCLERSGASRLQVAMLLDPSTPGCTISVPLALGWERASGLWGVATPGAAPDQRVI